MKRNKLTDAILFAQRVKSLAASIEHDCKMFDETWALGYAAQLKDAADDFLKTIK